MEQNSGSLLHFWRRFVDDYAFQIEMKYTAHKIGFKIKEVSVVFVNRKEGISKMSGGIFGEAFFGVIKLRWDGWIRKYPKIPNS